MPNSSVSVNGRQVAKRVWLLATLGIGAGLVVFLFFFLHLVGFRENHIEQIQRRELFAKAVAGLNQFIIDHQKVEYDLLRLKVLHQHECDGIEKIMDLIKPLKTLETDRGNEIFDSMKKSIFALKDIFCEIDENKVMQLEYVEKINKKRKTIDLCLSELMSSILREKSKLRLDSVQLLRKFRKDQRNLIGNNRMERFLMSDYSSFLVEINELALAIERMSQENTVDSLSDYKDNLFVSSFNRMEIELFRLSKPKWGKSTELEQVNQLVKDLRKCIFGDKYTYERQLQTVSVSCDGLYALNRERILLSNQLHALGHKVNLNLSQLRQVKIKLNKMLEEEMGGLISKTQHNLKNILIISGFLELVCIISLIYLSRNIYHYILRQVTLFQAMNQTLAQSQNKLVQSEKMAAIGQLAAGVAHEINNPVGFVKSNLGTFKEYLEVLLRMAGFLKDLKAAANSGDQKRVEELDNEINDFWKNDDVDFLLEDSKSLLDESLDGTVRVQEIVQNLKNFARADEGDSKDVDINEGVEATLKIVWNELKYKCEVVKDLNPLPLIKGNAGQLNQVIMNLLVNAAHAIPDKGTITIKTEALNDAILIKISDTGKGISPENLSKLFDPFFTTKAVGKGTGLGLSISHGIIEKHGGAIEVASELGKGTTFTISLPLENKFEDS